MGKYYLHRKRDSVSGYCGACQEVLLHVVLPPLPPEELELVLIAQYRDQWNR